MCQSAVCCPAGKVFLQRAAVNLLSTVLDTPEFFWSAPDHLQVSSGRHMRNANPYRAFPC